MAKRRVNGEGNIRKRKDGRWEGRYTAGYDPESGKRIIKNVLGKTQTEVKEKLKVAIAEGQRLDISKAGNYTVASWVRTRYEVYADRFHDMRHLFATLSLKNGVDVKTLSGALGHYSAGFTLNTYTHATAQMKQDAADTIGAVISGQM